MNVKFVRLLASKFRAKCDLLLREHHCIRKSDHSSTYTMLIQLLFIQLERMYSVVVGDSQVAQVPTFVELLGLAWGLWANLTNDCKNRKKKKLNFCSP